jgi:anti-sigma regulatory factor (Ser/Thr protein kinase)
MHPPDAAARKPRWTFEAADPYAAHAARGAFVAWVRARFAGAIDEAAAELVFGELTGNVARYAPGVVKIDVEEEPDAVVLNVTDEGPGFSLGDIGGAQPFDERGRGLMLVVALTRDLDVARTSDGFRVRAVLPVDGHAAH